jgi:glycerophosphoryl diester phosphodiesterase
LFKYYLYLLVRASYHVVIIFAHRGASGHAPENTIESFDRAIEIGTTAIETDVKATLDGQLVLFHDYGIGKFPFYRPLLTLTASQLQRRMAGISIPRIVDAFMYYRCKKKLHDILWSIDVPSHFVIGRLLVIARAFKNIETIYFCNEQAAVLKRWARDGVPSERVVWSIRDRQIARLGLEGVVDACKNNNIHILNVKECWLSRRLASAIRDAGLSLFIWDCHDERSIKRASSLGAEAIYTDFPDVALWILNQ